MHTCVSFWANVQLLTKLAVKYSDLWPQTAPASSEVLLVLQAFINRLYDKCSFI